MARAGHEGTSKPCTPSRWGGCICATVQVVHQQSCHSRAALMHAPCGDSPPRWPRTRLGSYEQRCAVRVHPKPRVEWLWHATCGHTCQVGSRGWRTNTPTIWCRGSLRILEPAQGSPATSSSLGLMRSGAGVATRTGHLVRAVGFVQTSLQTSLLTNPLGAPGEKGRRPK